jgi:Ca-activated chloride channel family protein
MRFHTYSKFSPEMADAVDLQSRRDKHAHILLHSRVSGPQGGYKKRNGVE